MNYDDFVEIVSKLAMLYGVSTKELFIIDDVLNIDSIKEDPEYIVEMVQNYY